MNRSLFLSTFLAFALAAGAQAAPARQIVLKLGTLAPSNSTWHNILKDMGEKWKTAPGGGVSLRLYPDGQLGDEPDMVRKMRAGSIQGGVITVVGLSNIDKSSMSLVMPMMYRDYAELDYVRGKMRSTLEAKLEAKGFVVLNWGDAGWVYFFGKEPILTPTDLKKMKFFVWAGDSDSVDLWKASGFQPIPLTPGEILTGLQTGMINTFDTTAISALSFQWFPLAPHMTDLKWAPLIGATVVTKKAWNSVPVAARAAVRKAAEEAGEQMRQDIRANDDKAIQIMKEKNLTVHTVTPAQYDEWAKFFSDAYPRMMGKIVPADSFQKAKSFRDEYRSKKQ
jgi:TRAP-type transport system periplasmic protein